MADRVDTPDPRKIRSAIEREVNAIMTDVLAEAKRQTPRDKSTLVRSAVKDVRVSVIGSRSGSLSTPPMRRGSMKSAATSTPAAAKRNIWKIQCEQWPAK